MVGNVEAPAYANIIEANAVNEILDFVGILYDIIYPGKIHGLRVQEM